MNMHMFCFILAESFIGADGKKKKKMRKGVDEVVESDFEYEIVSFLSFRFFLCKLFKARSHLHKLVLTRNLKDVNINNFSLSGSERRKI